MVKEIVEGLGGVTAGRVNVTGSKNTTAVQIGGTTLYFSYDTLVAVTKGVNKKVAINTWSNTTGKFLNDIDGGSKEAKANRVPQQDLLLIKL